MVYYFTLTILAHMTLALGASYKAPRLVPGPSEDTPSYIVGASGSAKLTSA